MWSGWHPVASASVGRTAVQPAAIDAFAEDRDASMRWCALREFVRHATTASAVLDFFAEVIGEPAEAAFDLAGVLGAGDGELIDDAAPPVEVSQATRRERSNSTAAGATTVCKTRVAMARRVMTGR